VLEDDRLTSWRRIDGPEAAEVGTNRGVLGANRALPARGPIRPGDDAPAMHSIDCLRAGGGVFQGAPHQSLTARRALSFQPVLLQLL